jgi:hypothetical protein
MDLKVLTKGEHQGEASKEVKTLELDFRGPFKQYDVMKEIGIDPSLLSCSDELRPVLINKVIDMNHKGLIPT